jgi:hypothetical protein
MILKELILKGSLQRFADDIAIVYQAENWTIIEDEIEVKIKFGCQVIISSYKCKKI